MVNKAQNQRRCDFDTDDLNDIMDNLAAKRLRATSHVRSLTNADEWLVVEDERGQQKQVKIH